jgi:hypothetical protein
MQTNLKDWNYNLFLAYFPYFENIKVGLSDLSVSVYPPY